MSSILIYGSVALDSIQTPFGKREEVLGGSGLYASMATALFVRPALLSTVGDDFLDKFAEQIEQRGVDLSFLVKRKGQKTFRWKGMYEYDMNVAHTLETHLNVLELPPPLDEVEHPGEWTFLLLANMDPEHQLRVKQKFPSKWVAADTMNLWIETKKDALLTLLSSVDIFFCNDSEARQLSGEVNLVLAAHWIQSQGPGIVVIKKGEHGSLLKYQKKLFLFPAYPLESVRDPTGAGDTFAGAACGYLTYIGHVDEEEVKRAVLLGTITASFTVSEFSIEGLAKLTPEKLLERYHRLRDISSFPSVSLADFDN